MDNYRPTFRRSGASYNDDYRYERSNRYANNIDPYDTLLKLNNLIVDGDAGYLSKEAIEKELRYMQSDGLIEIIGEGTNRKAVKVNGNVQQYIGSNKEVVFKIPYSVTKGINDNLRELLFIESLHSILDGGSRGDLAESAEYLLNVLPDVFEVKGFPALIAQEEITPIEKTMEVQKKMQYESESNEIGVCMQVIFDSYENDLINLLRHLDNVAIFADLNPVATPKQYGVVVRNGRTRLSILDTGYVIPKFPEVVEAIARNKQEARFLIPGDDYKVHEEDSRGKSRVTTNVSDLTQEQVSQSSLTLLNAGGYMLLNHDVRLDSRSVIVPDMKYFKYIFKMMREESRMDPSSVVNTYFLALRGRKIF